MKRSPIKRRVGRLKRAARKLKPVSSKRAARNRKASKVRKSFCEEIGSCEICGKRTLDLLAHEIPRGDRANAYTERAVMLCLCWWCHEEVHKSPAAWTKVRQLAVLKTSRPGDFSIERYNRLATASVSEDAVDYLVNQMRRTA